MVMEEGKANLPVDPEGRGDHLDKKVVLINYHISITYVRIKFPLP